MEIVDLIRIMVSRWERETVDGRRALVALSQSLGIENAFAEAIQLSELDR